MVALRILDRLSVLVRWVMPLLTALVATASMPVEKFDCESLLAIFDPSSFARCHEGAGHIVKPSPYCTSTLSNYAQKATKPGIWILVSLRPAVIHDEGNSDAVAQSF